MIGPMGLYNYLTSVTSTEWLEYGIVIVFIMFLITKVIRPTSLQVLALIIGFVFVFYRADRRRSTTDAAYTELTLRIKELYPKPENFHIDVDIMNFYYNMKDFRKFHSEGYDESLVAVDNMLKIVTEMESGVYNCKENLDIVKDQMNKAMNNFQAIIFKLPSDMVYQRRHKRALNALHILLRRHVDNMSQLCIKQYGAGATESTITKLDSNGSVFYGAVGYSQDGELKRTVMDINYHPIVNSGPRPNDLGNAESSQFDFYY